MKIYISGVMQGSIKGHGIQQQGYRQVISDAIKMRHPDAEIYDPFSVFPNSVAFDDQKATQTLFAMANEAACSDILIAYLPEASMGTALEMIRAYDKGKIIISISSLEKNWFVRAVSTKIFVSLEGFCDWIRETHLTELMSDASARENSEQKSAGLHSTEYGGKYMSSITPEMRVRKAVQSFYDAFNSHDFSTVSEFTTEDWTHINPLGGWVRGRKAVLAELKEVHATFLNGITDTPEEMEVRFAMMNTAIVTVSSKMSSHTTPDGVRRENQKQIRTFILVMRDNRWLIMQDQNTFREQ
jgi:uncharacterized protein (TIGR02246 family)